MSLYAAVKNSFSPCNTARGKPHKGLGDAAVLCGLQIRSRFALAWFFERLGDAAMLCGLQIARALRLLGFFGRLGDAAVLCGLESLALRACLVVGGLFWKFVRVLKKLRVWVGAFLKLIGALWVHDILAFTYCY